MTLSPHKKLILKAITIFNEWVIVPAARWCTSDLAQIHQIHQGHRAEYTEALSTINVAVMLAAVDDHKKELETNPQNCQATLNACLESVRHDRIGGTFVGMFGSLVASGYDPPEALYRVLANAVMLGMNLERRLKS